MPFQLDPIALGRVLTGLDLAPPIQVRPLGFPRSTAAWRLTFAPGGPVTHLTLKVTVAEPGHDPLLTERAALRLAGVLGELPVPQVLRLLPASVLGRPAMLLSRIPGIGGEELLPLGQGPALRACRAAGAALGRLGRIPHAGFASRATSEGTFVPRRATWREEFAAIVAGWAGRAAAWGTDLGPRSTALLDGIWDRLPALDGARTWGLVHGDLHPGTVALANAESEDLTGVVDWDVAMVGDPLVDWGAALHLPGPVLVATIEGFGRDRAAALLDGDGAERLEVYWRAHALHLLATASLGPLGQSGGRPRALALEFGRQALGRVDAISARERMQDALAASSVGPVGRRPRPSADLLLARRIVEVMRWGDRFGQIDAARIVGAVGGVGAARAAPPGHAAGWLSLGDRLVPGVPDEDPPPQAPPLGERAAWYRGLIQQVLGTPALDGAGLTLGLLAAVLDTIAGLDGAVADASFRGLESTVHGLLRLAEVNPASEPDRQLAHAWLGAWALRRLPGLPPTTTASLHAAFASRALGAWEDLGLGGPRPDPWGSAAAALGAWPAHEVTPRSEAALLLPALLRAWADGVPPPGIDAPPGAVLAVIGLS